MKDQEVTTMVVVGADVHKRTHTFVAVNEVGQQLGELRVSADGKGHAKALRWARQQFQGERSDAGQASPIRSTRSRWPGRCCGSRTCRSRRTMSCRGS